MMVGCIPVVIADEIELPYENRIDWSQLVVKIPEADAANTVNTLRQMTGPQIAAKQEVRTQSYNRKGKSKQP